MTDFVEYDDYQHRSDIEQHDEQGPGMIFIPQGSVYAELNDERKLADDLAAALYDAVGGRGALLPDACAVLARYREARTGTTPP